MSTKYVRELLPKHSLIIYDNIYYEIEQIIDNKYDIRRIEREIVKGSFKRIDQFDCEIRTIPQKTQKSIKKFNKFRESYNKMIDYLNKYKSTYGFPNYSILGLSTIIELINLNCGITERHLNKIQHYIKKTFDHNLEIRHLFINPFNFIKEENQLISYSIADKITKQLNIEIPFDEKCKKWAYYHIIHIYKSFYVEIDLFYNDFKDLCKQNLKKYTEYIEIINASIIIKHINGQKYVTTEYLYNFEKKLTKKLIDMYLDQFTNINYSLIDLYISEFEKYETTPENTFCLDSEQKNAIKNMLTHMFSVVTGFPGTGKTSIIKCVLFVINSINQQELIISNTDDYDINSTDDSDCSSEYTDNSNTILEDGHKILNSTTFFNSDVSIMSPTGIAYINIKKKCSIDDKLLFNPKISGTCHKTLYNTFPYIKSKIEQQDDDTYDKDNNDDIYVPKVIILDEVSMMDIFMFDELIHYCDVFKIHLIIVGDHNQLPSIGPGSVLNSIIETNDSYELFNVTNLVKIKRQDKGSLLTNIIKMQKYGLTKDDFVDDTMILLNISDFMNDDNTLSHVKIYELIETHCLNKDNCKFLSYFNGETEKSKSHPTNVLELNNILQNKFNSNGTSLIKRTFDKFTFKIGDVIIRTENETSKKGFRANGESAIIKYYDFDNIHVQYFGSDDDDIINVDKFYNEFKLAYALTVHKSQGSQYDNVVAFIEPNSKVWDKPAIYTAISRAKHKCLIIADYNEFLKVQKNIKNSKKPTLFLKEIETIYHTE